MEKGRYVTLKTHRSGVGDQGRFAQFEDHEVIAAATTSANLLPVGVAQSQIETHFGHVLGDLALGRRHGVAVLHEALSEGSQVLLSRPSVGILDEAGHRPQMKALEGPTLQ